MLQRPRPIAGDWWSTWERSTRGGLDARSADHTRLGRGYGASIRGKVQNRATDLGWAELPSVLRWFKGARVLTPIRYTHPASRHRAAREGSGCRCGRVPRCVPPQRHDHDQDARDAPRVSRQRAQPPALRNLRNEKVSLTTTLITKLLTNPLAQPRSSEDADDHSPASRPLHHTGRLSMAWKDHLTRSLDEVNSSITGYPAAGDTASDSAELCKRSRQYPIGAFFDDRQRAWRHLLQLRGKLSTTWWGTCGWMC
jgi:hypothetical protein